MHDAYIGGRFRRMKITRKASDAAENLQLYRLVRFFHPRTMHISADVQRITLNASCMTISGERTKQLDIFCRVTGFTSDFLNFIDVELIWFFHGAIQLNNTINQENQRNFFSLGFVEMIPSPQLGFLKSLSSQSLGKY